MTNGAAGATTFEGAEISRTKYAPNGSFADVAVPVASVAGRLVHAPSVWDPRVVPPAPAAASFWAEVIALIASQLVLVPSNRLIPLIGQYSNTTPGIGFVVGRVPDPSGLAAPLPGFSNLWT